MLRCARMHVFALCVLLCTWIFTKIFVVVYYSVMSLIFKFHKDPILRCRDICKIEQCFFNGLHFGSIWSETPFRMAQKHKNLKLKNVSLSCGYMDQEEKKSQKKCKVSMNIQSAICRLKSLIPFVGTLNL